MFKRKLFCISLLLLMFFVIGTVSATNYSFSNSTDVNTISKMISGDLPMKNGKYIKNGDVVKFTAGNYKNLKLVVNKKITVTTTKKGKNKVVFINTKYITANSTAIKINSNKVKVIGLKLKNYDYGVYGKTNSSYFNKMVFYEGKGFYGTGIKIKGKKNKILRNKFISSHIDLSGKFNIFQSNKLNRELSVYGTKNTIKKNNFNGKYSGINIYGNKNLIISNNIKKSDGHGISIGGKFNKVYSNYIYKAYWGINALEEYQTTYSKNKIYKCNVGIQYHSKKDKFIKNIFKGNKKNLIYSPTVM